LDTDRSAVDARRNLQKNRVAHELGGSKGGKRDRGATLREVENQAPTPADNRWFVSQEENSSNERSVTSLLSPLRHGSSYSFLTQCVSSGPSFAGRRRHHVVNPSEIPVPKPSVGSVSTRARNGKLVGTMTVQWSEAVALLDL
jgi:hypothetical protein